MRRGAAPAPAMPGLSRDQRLCELEMFVEQQQDMLKELGSVADQTQLQMKEITDYTEGSVSQLNDIFAGLSQELASLQNARASLEARLASLELLAEQQQEQIRHLSSAGSSLTREVAAVRVDHLGTREEHRALVDCLGSAGVVRPVQVRARSRLHRGLGMLREALDDKQVTVRTWRLAGNSVGRLLLASSAFNGLRSGFLALRADGGLVAASATGQGEAEAEKLLRAARSPSEPVWRSLGEYEPSARTLEKWANSPIVGKIFGNFVIENSPGSCGEMKFSHVHKLLSEVGLSTEHFVGKFLYAPSLSRSSRSSRTLEALANEILGRFAPQHSEGPAKLLRFRDIYRLLDIIGLSVERFEKQFAHLSDPELTAGRSLPYFGKYRAVRSIGRGSRGVCYLAEDARDKSKVAVKWPVQNDEVSTLRHLQHQQRAHPGLGLPRLLSTGEYQEQTYIVTQAFGSPLVKVFMHLEGRSAARRWGALSILGRLMVRRLQSLHAAGLVHCDISPENILLGPPPAGTGLGARFAPYLVDFGHARRFPGGAVLPAGDAGSIEWSSIRSANGREPVPEDDLQALGWVLLNGVFGELPWFKMLVGAYKDWDSRFTRDQMVRQAQQAKLQLLREGWQSFGLTRAKVPTELDEFIRTCSPEGSIPELDGPPAVQGGSRRHGPDYASLLRLLGSDAELSVPEAEEQDLRLFSERLTSLL